MEIETDINRIEKLARLREKANWAFRCFLKSSNLSIHRIDSKVHQLYRELSSRIECTSCANCCRVSRPLLTKADVKRLSQAQGLPVSAFRARYLRTDEDGEGETFNTLPCPFLKDNHCTVYDQRPADCRSFPHLHKREFIFRATLNYITPGLLLLTSRIRPSLLEQYIRKQKILTKEAVKA